MQSPEILLQDLNTALRELYGATQLLNDERLQTELPLAMRRLLLAEVLGTTSILAIGGSQGAGKTTLLRSLYALDGDDALWLQPNEGRGEKLPVLVLEDSAHHRVQGALRCLRNVDGQYRVIDEDVDVTTFQSAVSDPGIDVLLPVLKVPQRYFGRAHQAWLLLPGYETQDRDNKAWQELMRQALVGAAGCVVVTDETRLANQEQVKIVNDMLSNELRGAQALVVISKTEAARANPARLQELRSTAAQVFGVAPEQAGRWVVCTGADDEGYIDEWLPQLKLAINELSRAGGGDRKAQLGRLESVLNRDLSTMLGLISNKTKLLFNQREGGEEGPREVMLACLEAFDEARDTLREQYQTEVTAILDGQFSTAWKQLQNVLVDEHEGVLNRISDFFSKATESQRKIEGDVGAAWGEPGALLEQHAAAIGKLTRKALGAPEQAQAAGIGRLGQDKPLQRLGYVGADQQPLAWQRPDDNDQHNLRLVMGGRTPVVAGNTTQVTKEFERAVKLLPVLTLEYARLASLLPALVGVSADGALLASATERPDMMRQAVQQLGDGVELGKTVLRSVATVLTVDVVADGSIDVIPALLNALNPAVASSAAAGAAATGTGAAGTGGAAAIGGVGAAVVGVVAIGYLTYSALQATRAHDEKARVMAHAMLMSVKEQHQRHFQHHFDQMMNQVRSRLRQSLRERYRMDESLMEKDRLAKALADVRSLQRDLLDQLGRSGRTIGLFNVDTRA